MARNGLLEVRRYIVPVRVLELTLDALEHAGRSEVEGIVAWGGRRSEGDGVRFESVYVPRQTAYKTPDGLLVRVEDEALHQLNVDFNKAGLLLAGQAHSHPTDAFHSDTDDHSPIVTLLGGISLVVPDFARGGLEDAGRFAWYRLLDYSQWEQVPDDLIEVIR
jgi:hypothetical protein